MKIKILIFEDSVSKMVSFRDYLNLRLSHELNSELEIVQRSDDSMLESDLMTNNFHVILIDDDLGNNRWGNEIFSTGDIRKGWDGTYKGIAQDKIIIITDASPDVANVPKIYYSAGTSIDELENKVKNYGNIPCVTFQNLVDYVFERIKSKYFY